MPRAPSPSLLLVLGAWAIACSAVPVAWQEFREPQPEEHDLPPPPGPPPYRDALVVGTQLFWVWETPGAASVSGFDAGGPAPPMQPPGHVIISTTW